MNGSLIFSLALESLFPAFCLFLLSLPLYSFVKYLFIIYVFGCASSQLWHMGSLIIVAVCGIFSCGMRILNCGIWDLAPWPGMESGPPALGAGTLSHWTTREVPCPLVFSLFSFFFFKIYSKIVDLQCCVNFCCTAKWLSYTYVCILFHILFHFVPGYWM